jgi:hypothetical protein
LGSSSGSITLCLRKRSSEALTLATCRDHHLWPTPRPCLARVFAAAKKWHPCHLWSPRMQTTGLSRIAAALGLSELPCQWTPLVAAVLATESPAVEPARPLPRRPSLPVARILNSSCVVAVLPCRCPEYMYMYQAAARRREGRVYNPCMS